MFPSRVYIYGVFMKYFCIKWLTLLAFLSLNLSESKSCFTDLLSPKSGVKGIEKEVLIQLGPRAFSRLTPKEKIDYLRRERGLSVKELARISGVPSSLFTNSAFKPSNNGKKEAYILLMAALEFYEDDLIAQLNMKFLSSLWGWSPRHFLAVMRLYNRISREDFAQEYSDTHFGFFTEKDILEIETDTVAERDNHLVNAMASYLYDRLKEDEDPLETPFIRYLRPELFRADQHALIQASL